MAAGANRGVGLVVLAVRVAREAARASAARLDVRRRMAPRAALVLPRFMQSGQARGGVARRAGGGRDDAARSVRLMAGLAAALQVSMRGLRLGSVASGAARG